MKKIFIIILIFALFVIGCNKQKKVRKYSQTISKETKFHSDLPATKPDTTSTPRVNPFKWDTPKGWAEIKSSSQFRIASFLIGSQEPKALCTIIPLTGDAGGLKANVNRWYKQLYPDKIDEEDKVNFLLSKQEKSNSVQGFFTTFINFTLITDKPDDNSFLVALIKIESNSIFIKMMGKKSLLLKNLGKFKGLYKSFELRK